jgi:hypothetical protein
MIIPLLVPKIFYKNTPLILNSFTVSWFNTCNPSLNLDHQLHQLSTIFNGSVAADRIHHGAAMPPLYKEK